MLSRVANSLYWMSRYIERAENTARLVETSIQLLLDFRNLDEQHIAEQWLPIVQAAGDEEAFSKLHPKATGAAVTEFLVLQAENPNSIVQCICQARENARMVRDQISQELWEELNRLYLFVRSREALQVWKQSPTEFFSQIKASSLHLTGIIYATLIHNEGWWFSQVGRFLERADKTSRILDVRHQSLPETGLPGPVGQTEALEWAAILRSCSAWDAYKSYFGADVHPKLVTEFLVLCEDFPRSIRFCAIQVNTALRKISGVAEGRFVNDAERHAGRLMAELQFSTVEEIFERGLHRYLDDIQIKLNNIGDSLFRAYIFPFARPPGEADMVQQEEQQQQSHGSQRFMKRIGILTAGGDTPALNATIHGAVTRANQLKLEIYGLMKGFNGLFNSTLPHVHLNPLFQGIPELDPTKGGTLIGSSRDYVDPDNKEQLDQVALHLQKLGIEGLICVGGDGTLNGLQPLCDRLPVVLAPKTIDNDLGLNYASEPEEWLRVPSDPGPSTATATSAPNPTSSSTSNRWSITSRRAMPPRSLSPPPAWTVSAPRRRATGALPLVR